MKRLFGTLMLGAIITGVSVTTMAKIPRINYREHHQQERIRQGIQSGELTRREAARLEAEQARIRVNEAFAKADGNVSRRERARLNHQLNRASRDIYHQKHDRQDR